MNFRYKIWIGLLTAVVFLMILILIIFKNKADQRLQRIAGLMRDFGAAEIKDTITIEDTLQIETDFLVQKKIPVKVKMNLLHNFDFKANIPVNQMIEMPISITIDDVIKVDTGFVFKDKIIVPLDEIIHVDQSFFIPFSKNKKGGISIPILADIPLKQNISLHITEPVGVYSEIPVRLPVSQTIPVRISMSIPVDLSLPLNIPVNADAIIYFPEKLPVKGSFALKIKVPVCIPLSKTALKPKADSMANELERLLDAF